MKANRVFGEKLLTMQEAMDYLNERGYPCKSRSTFYRLLDDFKIQHMDVNPCGKNRIRRFSVVDLQKFVKDRVMNSSEIMG